MPKHTPRFLRSKRNLERIRHRLWKFEVACEILERCHGPMFYRDAKGIYRIDPDGTRTKISREFNYISQEFVGVDYASGEDYTIDGVVTSFTVVQPHRTADGIIRQKPGGDRETPC